MKTLAQINEARKKLCDRILKEQPSWTGEQSALITGMLNALVWAADGPDASTIQRVLDGEPLAKRK